MDTASPDHHQRGVRRPRIMVLILSVTLPKEWPGPMIGGVCAADMNRSGSDWFLRARSVARPLASGSGLAGTRLQVVPCRGTARHAERNKNKQFASGKSQSYRPQEHSCHRKAQRPARPPPQGRVAESAHGIARRPMPARRIVRLETHGSKNDSERFEQQDGNKGRLGREITISLPRAACRGPALVFAQFAAGDEETGRASSSSLTGALCRTAV